MKEYEGGRNEVETLKGNHAGEAVRPAIKSGLGFIYECKTRLSRVKTSSLLSIPLSCFLGLVLAYLSLL